MKLSSPAFQNSEAIPVKYTCDGDNISPPLIIEGVPEDARSLVLIMEDPDAPGKPFVHWLIYNFSPFTTKIEEGNLPGEASMGKNSSDNTGYTGPCPPSDAHRYIFKLYALSNSLSLQYPIAEDIYSAMDNAILAKAELIGTYRR